MAEGQGLGKISFKSELMKTCNYGFVTLKMTKNFDQKFHVFGTDKYRLETSENPIEKYLTPKLQFFKFILIFKPDIVF